LCEKFDASAQARPMTHDLLKSSLETLGYRVRSPADRIMLHAAFCATSAMPS
jgi:bifunctional DNase/RNase